MDDQNKKNEFDDFFQNREEGEEGKQQSEGKSDSGDATSSSETQSKPSYYYSYGPFKTGAQDDSLTAASRTTSSDDQSTPVKPFVEQQTAASASYNEPAAITPEPPIQAEITPPPQLRSFTSNQQPPKGGWQVREPKRKTSFRAMFISFLAGVVVVGGLMYTADVRNWFTPGTAALAEQKQSASGSTANGNSAQSNGGATSAVSAARPDNIAKLFETASPAVVKIETYVSTTSNGNGSGGGGILDDPFFRQFFGDEAPKTQTEPEQGQREDSGNMQASGIGTGFFFESTGYILTNQHVVGDSDKIEVTVQGYDKPLTAKLLGSSYELDLAVLKVEGDKAFPTLPLGNSDNINIGDWVVAIGNPYGFDHTVTVGVLSAKERPIDIQDTQGTREYKHLLQTDASINPGNSGGPLLNVNGEVVGINTAVSSQAQGIGFAIPTSTIQEVLETLKNNEEIPKTPVPFIGAELQTVDADIAKQLGMDTIEGSIVMNVYYNSPAYLADLKQFDVIVGIDGKKYKTNQDLIKAIQAKEVGAKIELNVIRKGESIKLPVEIGDKNKFNAQ
ncbi:MAG: S1C family serine protease [Candidatus Pristimantibacillus sp.]